MFPPVMHEGMRACKPSFPHFQSFSVFFVLLSGDSSHLRFSGGGNPSHSSSLSFQISVTCSRLLREATCVEVVCALRIAP